MIDVKQAIQVAKEKAADMLGQRAFNLEEIERDNYKGRDVWDITLSFVGDPEQMSDLARIVTMGRAILKYKRFLIDSETGELVAMRVREVATQ